MTGIRLGDYRLEEILGRGAMGEVHRAYDTRRHRHVALKLLSEHLAHNQEYQERFRRESHVAARLQEPHVIPIHDFGEIDGRLFIDMRLVKGTDLRKVLEQAGPLTPERAVDIVGQVAEALDAAHSDGLVHRDVKPANILVTSSGGFVYLVDFGIAHITGNILSLTAAGVPIGTPDYMAPERFDNKPADRRVDIYSLGCLLHECLTSIHPFPGGSIPALMRAHLYDPPPKPSLLCAGVPTALDDVVARAMAKDPDDRYATAGELATAARDALLADSCGTAPAETVRVPVSRSSPTPPIPSTPHTGFRLLKRRSHRLVVTLTLGATVLGTGAVLTVLFTNRSADATRTGVPAISSNAPPGAAEQTTPLTADPVSTRTAAEVFGADPRNGSCSPAESTYQATANDIEVLECAGSPYARYFYKYSGINPDGWVGSARSAYQNFTFSSTSACYDTYTATYMATDGRVYNSTLHVFRRAPFVAEVVAPADVTELDALASTEFYMTDRSALC